MYLFLHKISVKQMSSLCTGSDKCLSTIMMVIIMTFIAMALIIMTFIIRSLVIKTFVIVTHRD